MPQAATSDNISKINWGPIGKDVYERTYSRIKADGTNETWPETVERVVDGNLGLVDKKFWKRGERQQLIDLMLDFKALPAGRHLWVSGVKGRQFLFNCFSGDTLIHTKKYGAMPIRSFLDNACPDKNKEIEILSHGGMYRKAKIRNFGKQRLYRIVFSDGSEVFATRNHRWIVNKRKNTVTTDKLFGHDVPFCAAEKPFMSQDYMNGIAHGYVFGDGTMCGNSSTHVLMFGAETLTMSKIFENLG